MGQHNKHMEIPGTFRQDNIMGRFITNINNTKIDLNLTQQQTKQPSATTHVNASTSLPK
jgi:hypothetical protein